MEKIDIEIKKLSNFLDKFKDKENVSIYERLMKVTVPKLIKDYDTAKEIMGAWKNKHTGTYLLINEVEIDLRMDLLRSGMNGEDRCVFIKGVEIDTSFSFSFIDSIPAMIHRDDYERIDIALFAIRRRAAIRALTELSLDAQENPECKKIYELATYIPDDYVLSMFETSLKEKMQISE